LNLNLGCGELARPDCLNVDIRKTSITDVQWDISVLPWPWGGDEQFDEVWALDIIEHMLWVIPVMDEIWRVMKPEGRLHIRTTNYLTANSYRDPTHFHYFTHESFDFWDPRTELGVRYPYTERKFWVLERREDGEELVFELQKKV
jgi:2-polyprenyl-3-methyl-5-hydroxy-6-metoxy-1,4-benzoquinol methylase